MNFVVYITVYISNCDIFIGACHEFGQINLSFQFVGFWFSFLYSVPGKII